MVWFMPKLVTCAAKCRVVLILLKNNVLQVQKVAINVEHERLSCQALRVCCCAGKIFASLRRFWAVAASMNSSFAPHGPRNRNRPSPRMRLRWAKSISIFFRSRIEIAYCLVFAISRATCRASSCSSRVILRASAFGQHFIFDGHAWQVCFSAWYLATPLPVGLRLGSE